MSKARFGAVTVAAAVVISLLSGCIGVPASSGTAERGGGPPSADDIRSVDAALPHQPAAAADALVGTLFGTDHRRAIAAVADMLVRSGIAIVGDHATVIAASTHYVADELVPAAFLPAMTDSLLNGEFHDAGQVSALFERLGVAAHPLTGDDLAGVLRDWGKDAGSLPEATMAGDLVRALAARRDDLPVPGSSPGLDAVQLALLVAQLTGTVVSGDARPEAEGTDTMSLVSYRAGTRVSEEDAVCLGYVKKLDDTGKKIMKAAKKAGTKFLKAAWAESEEDLNTSFLAKYAEEAGETAENVSLAVSVAQTTMTTLMLIDGLRLVITDDKDHQTHFRHHRGDGSTDVVVTASAVFDSSIVDQEEIGCYRMLGIEIPNDGKLSGRNEKGELSGWQIVWRFGENIGRNGYYGSIPHGAVLRAEDPHIQATLTQPLDEGGEAAMTTMTRTERDEPNKGTVHKVGIDVVAKLDHVAPIEIPALVDPVDGAVAVLGMTAQAISAPSARDTITVGYHGPDIYTLSGTGSLDFVSLASMDFDAQYYTCDGLNGPWKGTNGYHASSGLLGALAQKLGYQGQTKGSFTDTSRFNLDEKVTAAQKIPIGKDGYGLQITLDNPPQRGEHVDGHVGVGTWLMPGDGSPVDTLADRLQLGAFGSGTTYQVLGEAQDPRCPGPTFEENTFDDETLGGGR